MIRVVNNRKCQSTPRRWQIVQHASDADQLNGGIQGGKASLSKSVEKRGPKDKRKVNTQTGGKERGSKMRWQHRGFSGAG